MAISFNGTSDVVTMGSVSALQLADNSPFSMCCWVNFATAFTATQSFLGAGFDGTNTGYGFQLGPGPALLVYSFVTTTHGATVSIGALGWSVGQWHHVYGEYTGTAWNIYTDGIFKATSVDAVGPKLVTGRAFAAGAVDVSGSFLQFFNGCMADPAVFNGPLTGTEITNLGNGTLRPNTGMSKTLLGYWTFDTNTFPQIDGSVNGNSGTIGGGAPGLCGTSPPYIAGTTILMGQICA